MTKTMTTPNAIRKEIHLDAPVARVWRALTDSREFGEWFRVNFTAPFVAGQTIRGNLLIPGYDQLILEATVTAIEPERRFAFTWHPYALDPTADYSAEPPTLVEFTLTPKDGGTTLVVTESGFDAIPQDRRLEAFRMNEKGWAGQVKNIERYVSEHP